MYLCFGDANTGGGGDIGVFGGEQKDAGDEIWIDLSSVLTRLLPAPTQMGSDGLRWAMSGNDADEDWRRQRLMIGRSVTLDHCWGWIKVKEKHGCQLKMEEIRAEGREIFPHNQIPPGHSLHCL